MNIKQYMTDVVGEMKKVSWSTREDLIASTIVVLVSVIVLAVYIGICDFVISQTMTLILR